MARNDAGDLLTGHDVALRDMGDRVMACAIEGNPLHAGFIKSCVPEYSNQRFYYEGSGLILSRANR
jgi:hypothetical protein